MRYTLALLLALACAAPAHSQTATGDWKNWGGVGGRQSGNAPGAFVCGTVKGALYASNAESAYLQRENYFSQQPPSIRQLLLEQRGRPQPPDPDLYGCILVPTGTPFKSVEPTVTGQHFVRVSIEAEGMGLNGITMDYQIDWSTAPRKPDWYHH